MAKRSKSYVKNHLEKLEKLQDRLQQKLHSGKIKSKLIKGKTHIPGFGYYFKTK